MVHRKILNYLHHWLRSFLILMWNCFFFVEGKKCFRLTSFLSSTRKTISLSMFLTVWTKLPGVEHWNSGNGPTQLRIKSNVSWIDCMNDKPIQMAPSGAIPPQVQKCALECTKHTSVMKWKLLVTLVVLKHTKSKDHHLLAGYTFEISRMNFVPHVFGACHDGVTFYAVHGGETQNVLPIADHNGFLTFYQ